MLGHQAKAVVNCAVFVLFLAAAKATAAECGPTRYDCALYYVGRQDFASAVRTLKEILRSSPRDLKTLNLLGIALTGLGRIKEANRQFEKALKLNSRFYPALKNLAGNELALKRTEEAKRHLKQVLEHAPEDEVANLMLGELWFAEKRCDLALQHYDKCRMRIVNNTQLILHFSLCSLDQKRSTQATKMLNLLSASEAEGHLQAGLMLGQAGHYAEAAEHFGLARRASGDPYGAGYNETLMYIRAGNYKAAIRTASELFAQGFRTPELYSLVSQAYLGSEQIKEAYDALRAAAEIDPKNEDHYLGLAAICLEYSNYDLGIEILDVALRRLPDSDRLYLQRGVMLAMKGQFTAAEEDFTAAQRLAPEKPLVFVAQAMALMQKGQFQQALEMLRENARQYRDDYIIQWLFGQTLVRAGLESGSAAENEAQAAFETSLRLNPNFAYALADLGKLFLKRGEVDRAIELLEKAIQLDPSQVGPTHQLALAYRKKGDTARAEELLARVAQLNVQERESDTQKQLKRIVKMGTGDVPSREKEKRQ